MIALRHNAPLLTGLVPENSNIISESGSVYYDYRFQPGHNRDLADDFDGGYD